MPHLLHCACGLEVIQDQRKKVVPLAEGRVLEVGMGSGLNIPFYDREKVEIVWGLEPSAGMRKKAQPRLCTTPIDIRWLDLPGESIPLHNGSVDTVLLTYTLCTIPDWRTALQHMRRVLKPDGTLIFCEHGLSPDAGVRRWQKRLTPLWKKLAGGCHLDRPIPQYIEAGGFTIHTMNAEYIQGPKFAAYQYWGTAK
ncbi:MAG: class I SAM-dependent methyltransferase [Nitrospirales bacterium]|nr:class I SAM-dependent methyltransferase [Nitrospira sp.]MDR4502005.1 class I SAM-dependent methyltransferase [Nitrospirales bacterium]